MPRETYACCGGGFPLLLRGTGAIGTICVSGLADTEDHQVIINTLDKYFDKIL